jgi:monovalent cation:H+ antiporter-2, CPA2 family
MAFLEHIVIVIGVGAIVSVLFERLKLPAIAGLLLAGALIGPNALRILENGDNVASLARVGVIILLFSIGLEFSLSRLGRIAKLVAVGGLLQVSLTVVAVWIIAVALGFSPQKGLLFGFALSLSSTAIVLRALAERGELDAPHGRFVVGALVFQDLCVVPMVLVIPILASGSGGAGLLGVGLALGKAAATVVAAVALSKLLVPRLFSLVDAGRSRETFVLAVLAVCGGTAWLTSAAGLSLELGAFLAGLVLAETDYGHRAMSDVLPLRDVLMGIFFVSLGMLFDPHVIVARPGAVGLVLGVLLLGKGAIAAFTALLMRFPARAAFLAGVGLAQFGEFGFVLIQLGEKLKIASAEESAIVLAAGVVSMFVTPLLVHAAPHITAGEALLRPLCRVLGARGIDEPAPQHKGLEGHVVIIGYGLGGRLLAQALGKSGFPYIALELNAETVRDARARNEPLYYGDATSREALAHAGVDRARQVVVAINDPRAARRTVNAVKLYAPMTPVLLRCRYLSDHGALVALGANDVVVQELEAGVEIIVRVLRDLSVPRNVIDERIREIRAQTQASARRLTVPRSKAGEMEDLAGLKVERFLVRQGSYANGRSIAGLRLREVTGALIVSVRRKGALLEEPDPNLPLEPDDVVYIVGSGPARRAARWLLETGDGGSLAPPPAEEGPDAVE